MLVVTKLKLMMENDEYGQRRMSRERTHRRKPRPSCPSHASYLADRLPRYYHLPQYYYSRLPRYYHSRLPRYYHSRLPRYCHSSATHKHTNKSKNTAQVCVISTFRHLNTRVVVIHDWWPLMRRHMDHNECGRTLCHFFWRQSHLWPAVN